MDKQRLKPCPFCGGEAYTEGSGGFMSDNVPQRWIECSKCGASICFRGTDTIKVEKLVMKAWNRRTP